VILKVYIASVNKKVNCQIHSREKPQPNKNITILRVHTASINKKVNCINAKHKSIQQHKA